MNTTRYEYAIWGIYGNDTSESLLAAQNRQGEFIKSRAEADEVIADMQKAVEAGRFLPIKNVRIQQIDMVSGDIVSMFAESIAI